MPNDNKQNLSKQQNLVKSAGQLAVSFVPVLLIAIYPTLLLYQTNVSKLTLSNLGIVATLYALIALVVYLLSFMVSRFNPAKAGSRAFIFMIFFNTYGWIYSFLVKLDWFRVEHYTLLPFFLLVAVYLAFLISKIDSRKFQNAALIFVGLAVGLSLVNIIPNEISKRNITSRASVTASTLAGDVKTGAPDVYYIIMDEFAGFNSMRSYWQYQEVDQFVDYLENKGFYVAQNSKSDTTDTLHELAERLNYSSFPYGANQVTQYFSDIYNNKVMQDFKNLGYTTVVFDEMHLYFPSFTHINADYIYDYSAISMGMSHSFFDDFGIMVAEKTMLKPFLHVFTVADPTWAEHAKWITYNAAKVGDLKEISGPKFVFVHYLLPHNPFMFDKYGRTIDAQFYTNWNYYLGNYEYAISIITRTVNNILSQYDSTNQPIIILQSDHGARNRDAKTNFSAVLSNYPEEDAYDIMNALYLPGYDYSTLTQDIKPVNTFPIILNHYFGENIPMQ